MKKVLLAAAIAVALAAIGFVTWMGPRNVIGMLRYDQRREGHLKVGDRAPDGLLVSLDGKGRQPLLDAAAAKPSVLVFGSFT